MMKGKEEKREFWPLVLFPLWDIFWSTFSSPFYTYYIPFRSSGSQKSNALNGVQIGVETKKLWPLQENCAEMNEKFAPCESRCENFRTVRNTPWHMSAISHTSSPFSHRAKQGVKISHTTIQGAKFNSRCEIPNLRCENFATVGHNFEALPGAQIMHMICRFKAWEVRNLELQTVCDLDLKRRSYGRLKTTMQS